MGGLEETYRRSLEEPEAFWAEAAAAIDWDEHWQRVLDDSRAPFYRWFAGGRMNTCFNALDRHVERGRADQPALIYDSPVTDTVTTTTGGAFSFPTQPLKKTAYSVKSKNLTSSAATVNVQPRLRLSKVARHRYSVKVSAAQSFVGKVATFQRFRATLHRWVKVKRVTLKKSTAGTAPTVITSAKFRSRVRTRLRVRVTLGQKQVGSCYLAGHSNTIRS